ncbi:MAG: HP0495 family protein [Elusimicrobiota bacterium]
MKKPDIEYPCTWTYKIFGTNKSALQQGVRKIMDGGKYEYDLKFSRKSRTGKYVSMSLKIDVPSEKVRNKIYSSLKNSQAVTTLF